MHPSMYYKLGVNLKREKNFNYHPIIDLLEGLFIFIILNMT